MKKFIKKFYTFVNENELEDNEVEILNYTPHTINIVDSDGNNIQSFPSVGVARVSSKNKTVGKINGISLIKQTFGDVYGLPDEKEGVYLIVSGLLKSASPDRKDLVSPGDLVRDSSGQPVGCKNLSV